MSERSVNRVELMGRLGGDVEVRTTPSGLQVGTFNLATGRRWKDAASGEWKNETEWHRIVYWKVDKVAQYLKKGKRVRIVGRIKTRSYTDSQNQERRITEIIVGGAVDDPFLILSPVDGPARAAAPATQPQSRPQDDGLGITDDDVPF